MMKQPVTGTSHYWYTTLLVHRIFSVYQNIHVSTDLYSVLFSRELHFYIFFQMRELSRIWMRYPGMEEVLG